MSAAEGLRPRVFAGLLGLVLAGQALALADALGLRWPDPFAVCVVATPLSLVVGARFWRRLPATARGSEGALWVGAAAWALWAGAYYLVAWAVGARATPLSPPWTLALESRWPIVPASVLVYLGVHPLSVMPYYGLRSARAFERHALGHLAIVGVSVLAWVCAPVSLPRAALPDAAGSLGMWVLASMRGHDPAVNCLPSTHCSLAVYSALALRPVGGWIAPWALCTALAIALSTLLTRQHYALDVVVGVALGVWVSRRVHS